MRREITGQWLIFYRVIAWRKYSAAVFIVWRFVFLYHHMLFCSSSSHEWMDMNMDTHITHAYMCVRMCKYCAWAVHNVRNNKKICAHMGEWDKFEQCAPYKYMAIDTNTHTHTTRANRIWQFGYVFWDVSYTRSDLRFLRKIFRLCSTRRKIKAYTNMATVLDVLSFCMYSSTHPFPFSDINSYNIYTLYTHTDTSGTMLFFLLDGYQKFTNFDRFLTLVTVVLQLVSSLFLMAFNVYMPFSVEF